MKPTKAKNLIHLLPLVLTTLLKKAKEFDKKPNSASLLPGIPLAVKDLFALTDSELLQGVKC